MLLTKNSEMKTVSENMLIKELCLIIEGGNKDLISKIFTVAGIKDYRSLTGDDDLHLNISKNEIKKEFSQKVLIAIFKTNYIENDKIMISSDHSLSCKSIKFNKKRNVLNLFLMEKSSVHLLIFQN